MDLPVLRHELREEERRLNDLRLPRNPVEVRDSYREPYRQRYRSDSRERSNRNDGYRAQSRERSRYDGQRGRSDSRDRNQGRYDNRGRQGSRDDRRQGSTDRGSYSRQRSASRDREQGRRSDSQESHRGCSKCGGKPTDAQAQRSEFTVYDPTHATLKCTLYPLYNRYGCTICKEIGVEAKHYETQCRRRQGNSGN